MTTPMEESAIKTHTVDVETRKGPSVQIVCQETEFSGSEAIAQELVVSENPRVEDHVPDSALNGSEDVDQEVGVLPVAQYDPSCQERQHPSEFYCPLSNQLFQDPVVAADGESYERAIYLERKPQNQGNKVYTNRALRIIIDDAIMQQSGSIQANLKRIHYAAEQAVWEFLDQSDAGKGQEASLPLSEGFYCPITFNIIHDPVIDPEGNTYEKVAAVNWIIVNGTSPVTRTPLRVNQLYPNKVIRRLLEKEKSKPENEIHPEIRRFMNEPVPKATDVEHGGGIVATAASSTQYPNGSPSTLTDGMYYPTPLPTTQLQRYRRRMSRRQFIINAFGITLCILSIVGLMLLGKSFFLLMFMMTLIIIFSKKRPIR